MAMPSSSRAVTARWSPEPAWRTRLDGNRPPDDQETVVVLSLESLGESTTLTVDQGDFATEERRALHVQGWSESIDRLEELIASQNRSAP